MMVARRRTSTVKGNVNGALADRKCSGNENIAEQMIKVNKKAAAVLEKTAEKTTRPRGKSIAESKLKDKNGNGVEENKSKNNNMYVEKTHSSSTGTTGPTSTTTTTTNLAGKKRERQAGNSDQKRRRSNPISKKVADAERNEAQSKAKVAAKVVHQPTFMRKPTDAPQVFGPPGPLRQISQNKRNLSVATQIIDLNSSSEDEASPRKGAGVATGARGAAGVGANRGAAGAGSNRGNQGQAQVAPTMKFGGASLPTTASTTMASTTTAATTTTATTTSTNPFMRPPQSTTATTTTTTTTTNPFMPAQSDRDTTSLLSRSRDEFKRLQELHFRETNELNKKQGLQQEELNRHHHQQRYRKNSVVGRREQAAIREQHANEHRRLKENQEEEMRRMRIKLMTTTTDGGGVPGAQTMGAPHGKQTGAPLAGVNEPTLGAPKRKRVEPEQHDQKRRQVAHQQAPKPSSMEFMTPLSHLPVKSAAERIYDQPIYFPEYREENFRICKENQLEFAPTDYINSLEEITNNNRTLVVDWLIEIHYKYRFSPESIYIGVSVLDRFLALRPKTQRKKLQLYAGTCLLLAAKFQERIPISMNIADACYIMDYLYDETAVRYAECEIMDHLDFKLYVPSPYIFLQNNVVECHLGLNDRIYYLALFFLDVTLLDAYFLRYTPQERALGALYLAMTTGGLPWPQSLTRMNGYDEAQVKLFAAKIKRAYPEYQEKTVYKKYKRVETQEVVKHFNL